MDTITNYWNPTKPKKPLQNPLKPEANPKLRMIRPLYYLKA